MKTDWAKATGSGDVEQVRALLDAGIDVNALDRYGQTAVMNAAHKGHSEVVRLLAERGADLDHAAKFGLSALMLAVIADHPLGHTTITQSIGKGLFFNSFNPGFLRHRKIQLMVATLGLDRRISKDTQLRLFLNRAYFGSAGEREVVGFPAAASAFYGKPLGQLSDLEYFGLLAMLEAPNSYHVVLQPKVNAERAARIKQKVQKACGEGCFQGDAPVPCAIPYKRNGKT